MYQIQLDFPKQSVVVPISTIAALGFPKKIHFLYHREDGMIGIKESTGPIMVPSSDGKSRPYDPAISLLDKWDEDKKCFVVPCIVRTLALFAEHIPNFNPRDPYLLTGDYHLEDMIGFLTAEAIPGAEFTPVDLAPEDQDRFLRFKETFTQQKARKKTA